MSDDELRDAFRGALLGTFVGDALGAPFEGLSAARMDREHGEVREMMAGRLGKGTYTDDTQMTVAVGEWLLEDGGQEAARLARRLVNVYDPARGYGRGTTNLIRKLRGGAPWESAVESVFPRGSFGNGAAIRVAPCAVLLHDRPEALDALVETSAIATHTHPLGVAGAILQGRQIALALESRGGEVDPLSLAVALRSMTTSDEFRHKLRTVEECLERGAGPDLVRDRLGCNSTALGSVPTALYCFLSRIESFEEAVVFAVRLGGDTDSVAAMTGAIAGAYHGASAIPARWRSALEEGPKGAAYVTTLADRLFERAVAQNRRPARGR